MTLREEPPCTDSVKGGKIFVFRFGRQQTQLETLVPHVFPSFAVPSLKRFASAMSGSLMSMATFFALE